MNKRIKRLGVLTGLFILLVSLKAAGAPANYSGVKAQFNITGPNNELAAGKNRFVISLDKAASQLHFLDTWNWRVLNPAGSDTVSLFGTVASMDTNVREDRLYFSYDNGKVRWMDLAPLFALDFGEELNPDDLHVEAGTTIALPAGTSLNRIVAVRDSDSVSFDCVFVELQEGDTSSLRWLLLRGNTLDAKGSLSDSVGTNMELGKARQRLFVKAVNAGGNSFVNAYRCFSNGVAGEVIASDDLGIAAGNNYKGLAANRGGNVLILGNQDLAQLWPFEIVQNVGNTLAALPGPAYDRLSGDTADQLWVTKISAEPNTFVFIANGDTLRLSTLAGDSAQFQNLDPIQIATFPSSPLRLAASGAEDGYIYVAPANSQTVSIITANPWITNLATSASGTILTETFKLKFSTNRPNSFFTVAPCPNFSISPSGCGDELASGQLDGSTANITIASRDLGEGAHILGVFLRDRYPAPFHQGRNALKVTIDLPPPPQQFDLGWGDQRIFIKFKSPDVKDLARYVIYYGTNCAAGFYKPGHIDASGGNGDPPSPIIITDPERDHDYEKVVEDLVNGTTYCAQIVLVDKAGNQSVSERNSATPEKTKTPSQDAGEKGNISCSVRGPLPPGAPARSDLILLLLPLAAVLALKIKLRSRR